LIDGKKEFQVELFQECNNMCKFCFLGDGNRRTRNDNKLEAINATLKFLSDDENLKDYYCLSFIGGEFFQGQLDTPEVRESFFKLMSKASDLLRRGLVKTVWCSATLTLGDQKDLYEMLDLFRDVEYNPKDDSGFWIIASYDTTGRFHTQKYLDSWDYHMLNIQNRYPWVKFNTCTILSQHLVDRYLDGRLDFREFSRKYKTSFFFKQPAMGGWGFSGLETNSLEARAAFNEKVLAEWFPTRKSVLKFFAKLKQDDEALYEKLFNIKYRADELFRNFNYEEDTPEEQRRRMAKTTRFKDQKEETDEGFGLLPCGHPNVYQAYVDSDKCWVCDRDSVGG